MLKLSVQRAASFLYAQIELTCPTRIHALIGESLWQRTTGTSTIFDRAMIPDRTISSVVTHGIYANGLPAYRSEDKRQVSRKSECLPFDSHRINASIFTYPILLVLILLFWFFGEYSFAFSSFVWYSSSFLLVILHDRVNASLSVLYILYNNNSR